MAGHASQIIVLADDFSGAAELAGIAFARGLSAEVRRVGPAIADRAGPPSQVLAIDTDSRHLDSTNAAARVKQITQQIIATKPAWLYKKVDSLLRGNVRAEIEAILQVTGQPRALLIPANPSRDRVIRQGRYFVGGVPLAKTAFQFDPDQPRQSSDVMKLISAEGSRPIHRIDAAAPLPPNGIIIPDVATHPDLMARASAIHSPTLPAGAADFFAALLGPADVPDGCPRFDPPALLICGSAVAWPTRREQALSANVPILTIADPSLPQRNPRALLLGIGEFKHTADANSSSASLAQLSESIISQIGIKTLLLEGGATAEAIANHLGWYGFTVAAPGPAGVGILKPINDPSAPLLLIKPGSYAWPTEIWQAFCAAVRQ